MISDKRFGTFDKKHNKWRGRIRRGGNVASKNFNTLPEAKLWAAKIYETWLNDELLWVKSEIRELS